MTVLDLFAGPGGWDKGAEDLGLRPIGIEKDEWACKTRACAGLLTIRADVTTLDPGSFGIVDGLIASPPCPDFSVAGKRAGIDGETGRLMWEVPRWVKALRPRWVACEQVPPALDWWRTFALGFAALGYRAWSGLLTSADFGTPQNRLRAFLLLHRDRHPFPPAATHAEDPHPLLDGSTLKPWVSLAQGLGWDDAPLWSWERNDGTTRTVDASRPAPTVLGHRAPRWMYREGGGAVLNPRRDQRPDGTTQTRTLDRPAPTLTAKSAGQWIYERPSTTVCATPRIAKPGHHERQWDGSIALTMPGLGTLQDFPPDYPWQGNKSQQAKQVGNAVPVRLARAVLEAVTK